MVWAKNLKIPLRLPSILNFKKAGIRNFGREGLEVVDLKSEVDRQDRDIRDWQYSRIKYPIMASPELWKLTETFYIKLQRIFTYWPYSLVNKEYKPYYKMVKLLLELPQDIPDLYRIISQKIKPKITITTVDRRIKRLTKWVALFDFESLEEWGPDSRMSKSSSISNSKR